MTNHLEPDTKAGRNLWNEQAPEGNLRRQEWAIAIREVEAEVRASVPLDRITSLRGALASIADGRGPAQQIAQAALTQDDARLTVEGKKP